jgi:phosphonopyruvate decarboxylase
MMERTACLAEIARLRGDALVIAVYSTAFDWISIAPHPLNFLSVGAMGQASSSGLGFAIALPHKKVIVLDGDGSLLMNLGSLVTIANVAPENFIHFVSHNGCYEANGEHPIPGHGKISFATMARAAGYRHVTEFSDLATLQNDLPDFIAKPGPNFATLHVKAGEKPKLDYQLVHGEAARHAFQKALHEDMRIHALNNS